MPRVRRAVPQPRKPVAFAVHTYPGSAHIIAQAEDGSLWLLNWGEKRWRRLPELPPENEPGEPV